MPIEADSRNGGMPLNSGTSHDTAGSFESRAMDAVQGWIDRIAPCPWTAHAGYTAHHIHRAPRDHTTRAPRALYTPEQRRIRDETPWTLVQGLLAPFQFVVFLVSLWLVISYLGTGEGYAAATISVVVKTFVLYTIMITGAIWEKVVFGRYLFAPAFFWEDVFSMLVLALHTAYLAAVLFGIGSSSDQMILALAAYATYVINAAQFIWKLRMARLEGQAS